MKSILGMRLRFLFIRGKIYQRGLKLNNNIKLFKYSNIDTPGYMRGTIKKKVQNENVVCICTHTNVEKICIMYMYCLFVYYKH